jgi:hypothetical protein
LFRIALRKRSTRLEYHPSTRGALQTFKINWILLFFFERGFPYQLFDNLKSSIIE